MLIESVPLWFTQTNCYVAAPEAGGPCVVIDAPPDPREWPNCVQAAIWPRSHWWSPMAMSTTSEGPERWRSNWEW